MLYLYLRLFALARLAVAAAIHFGVGRCHRPRLAVLKAVAVSIHDAVVMLRMLIKIFCGNTVAAGRRLASQRDVALEDLIGIAANFDARPIAVERLYPVRRARPTV